MTDEEWQLVTDYDIKQYSNGLRHGDRARLSKELVICDSHGKPTGEVHPIGEVWTVLPGVAGEPNVVWLRTPDGDRHTWDVDGFFEWFKLVDNSGE